MPGRRFSDSTSGGKFFGGEASGVSCPSVGGGTLAVRDKISLRISARRSGGSDGAGMQPTDAAKIIFCLRILYYGAEELREPVSGVAELGLGNGIGGASSASR